MKLEIKIYEQPTGEFWCLMGKYFAHRCYAHEMGGWQFYTKPGSVWFLAFVDRELVGFCSAINENNRYWYFDNFYVFKEHRGVGVGSALHEARWKFIIQTEREVRVISDNPIQIRKYQQQGFSPDGMRGKYSKFKYRPNHAK